MDAWMQNVQWKCTPEKNICVGWHSHYDNTVRILPSYSHPPTQATITVFFH